MTYSIAAKCPRTGMFGAAVTTSSIAVGARCVYARAGVGVVLTQHRTDPRLGPKGLELLAQGLEAREVIRRLTEGAPGIEWRQLAVVDREGRTAVFHGDRISSVHSADEGPCHVAIGNIIITKAVTRAMADAFAADPQLHIAERLVRAMEAGYAAGGEPKQVKSAALLVVDRESFPLIDLRVDYDPQPLVQLRWLWEIYEPSVKLYVDRAVNPDSVPGPA
jgi:uncharacterized Ntn-hydrolase superfamily protein